MKKLILLALSGLASMTLLSGCLMIQLGGGRTTKSQAVTVGQQLIDLQKAKDAGAISEPEYQAEKSKILSNR